MEGPPFAEICRRHGLRVSRRRLIVLEVLDAAVDQPTVAEIYLRAVSRDDRVCYTTVYRVIGDLLSAGVIAVVDRRDGKPRYHRASERDFA